MKKDKDVAFVSKRPGHHLHDRLRPQRKDYNKTTFVYK